MELEVGFEPTRAHADGLQDRCHQPLGDSSICIFDRGMSTMIAAAALTVITLTSCSSFFIPLRRNERR